MAKVPVPLLFLFLSLVPSTFQALRVPPHTTSLELVAPIHKDPSTLQYIISVYLQTPLKLTHLLLDLGSPYTWVNCDDYNSSTYQHIPCNGSLVDIIGPFEACYDICDAPPSPNCGNNTYLFLPDNPIKPIDYRKINMLNAALLDTLALPSTSTQASLSFINNFIFSCARTGYLNGLAKGVTGLAALGYSNISIPVQFNRIFTSSPHCFAICLSGSSKYDQHGQGVAIFNTRGPYDFLPVGIDLSKSLIYTPLILNSISMQFEPEIRKLSPEYYIGLTSIKVNGMMVAVNRSLLAIDGFTGSGGSIISTIVPYTKLETSIYKAFTWAFLKEASSHAFNLTPTSKPIRPFSFCYHARDLQITETGPAVPTIDLVFHTEDVVWKIYGSNSVVRIKKNTLDLWCLGFVDGGAIQPTPRPNSIGGPAIVIGGHQLEDNVLQFDLQFMKLGFSSSILSRGTNCSSFRFPGKNV